MGESVEIQYVGPSSWEWLKETIRTGFTGIRHKMIRALGGVPAKRGNTYNHAKTEMDIVWPEYDEMQELVKSNVLDLVSAFSAQGHSGFSASYVLNVFNTVAKFKPIGPLTGEEWEWEYLDYDDEMLAQNRRHSSVFKRRDGTAYDIDAVVFRELDGVTFTSNKSKQDIVFPYTPETIIVDVDEDGNAIA